MHAPNGQPRVGSVSSDRVAIFGRLGYSFLFGGSTGYFALYGERQFDHMAERWADLLERRRQIFGRQQPLVSLFIPNKTTCLADLYPIALPDTELRCFVALRTLLSGERTALFADSLRALASPSERCRTSPWRMTDTHWTSPGAFNTANEVLSAFGLETLEADLVDVDPYVQAGDLSYRWPETPMLERFHARYRTDLPEPVVDFDLLPPGIVPTVVTGRRIVWSNPEARFKQHLLLVANSFCGPGTDQDQLSWWFSRIFTRVTFVHSGSIPCDALSLIRPDLILFQQVERFLPVLPEDNLSLDEIGMQYTSRLGTA